MVAAVESMMYVGSEGTPWHGLGTSVDKVATAAEAMAAAKLDWTVSSRPVFTTSHPELGPMGGNFMNVEGSRAIVRDSDNRVYTVVSDRYKPLQNAEAFDFLDQVVGKGQAIYHTAGSLDNGRQVWILAKLPENMVVLDHDVTEQYLLICNGHDGSMAVRAMFEPVRVVCQNTLQAGIQSAVNSVSIRHTGDLQAKFKLATKTLGIATKYFAELQTLMQELTRIDVDAKLIEKFGEKLFVVPKQPEDDEKVPQWEFLRATQNRRRQLLAQLVEVGQGTDIPGVRGSMYGLYQASVELLDHYYKEYRTPEQHMKESIFGGLTELKQNALDLAMKLS